ncbi:MAG: hypothetical protein JWO58_324 [Chitinophagaceae bacterium]|nr:hypothetical protein [Chitinophagaceae bacterium]
MSYMFQPIYTIFNNHQKISYFLALKPATCIAGNSEKELNETKKRTFTQEGPSDYKLKQALENKIGC